MASLYFLVWYSCIVCRYMLRTTAYTLTPSQSIPDGQTLISKGGTFELGFFSPSTDSENRYVGIWYKTIPTQTVVWVANRDSPLPDTSGVLKIDKTGNIVIVNQTEGLIWSSNSSKTGGNPIVEFLESGNIVLRDAQNGDPRNYFWQSFDYPGNTLLPGMKFGWNLKTGMNRYLSSWKSFDDPSHGDFTYGLDGAGYIEPVMRYKSNKYYRGGPWDGVQNNLSPNLSLYSFKYEFTYSAEEVNFQYQLVNRSVVLRLVLTQTGNEARLQRFRWAEKTNSWVLLVSAPRDRCDDYALCGAGSTCDVNNVALCQCLRGFRPISPQDWSASDWSEGCERKISLNCSQGEGFVKLIGVKSPEKKGTWFNMSMNLDECGAICLKNCSCMAYTNADIRKGGSGCIMWFTELTDVRQLSGPGQDLYIRMAASELDSVAISRTKKRVIMTVSFTIGTGIIVLSLGIWGIWKKRRPKGKDDKDGLELPLYELETLKAATENFSTENKLGEGGFGPVYKGKLENDQEIAVKRLSKDSIQGIDEFKNEVLLISKLQHRNLVRLLGCCIQKDEKMLVYEYMQNKSLDSSLFDETKSRQLDWQKRFGIILGIARGLLYLHHDSRLRIIHRDLKASNILLDGEMVPKISDFGMAKLFGGDQVESRTKRVVGTYGYMSPEYAIDGYFSVKSDVFSFGVLTLEIISGKKNRSFSHPDRQHNLAGHAWRLWNQDKALEFAEASIRDSCHVEDVLRCIHIGLLCVQKGREQRPTMPSVVLMLSSETAVLLKPQQPGFYMERSTPANESLPNNARKPCTSNEMSITWLEGR